MAPPSSPSRRTSSAAESSARARESTTHESDRSHVSTWNERSGFGPCTGSALDLIFIYAWPRAHTCTHTLAFLAGCAHTRVPCARARVTNESGLYSMFWKIFVASKMQSMCASILDACLWLCVVRCVKCRMCTSAPCAKTHHLNSVWSRE